jgi:hypothetical protein
VIFCWDETTTRLWILWDNDRRDSLMSLGFNDRSELFAHIASCVNSWRKSYDVEISDVLVKNPLADHQSWLIDWDPSDEANARCITIQ